MRTMYTLRAGRSLLSTQNSYLSLRFASDPVRSYLEKVGVSVGEVFRNAAPAVLVEHAIRYDPGSALLDNGALSTRSGAKTGRSPKDKRIVDEPETTNDVGWGAVNIKMTPSQFMKNRNRAISYLNTRERLYVIDGYAGWDPRYRKKIRVVCERPYHALFMHVMLIRPSAAELQTFGEPDVLILNAGKFTANNLAEGMTSDTSVDLHLTRKEMVILGTQYAGEMKKGVLTYVMYASMKEGCLPLHASMNQALDKSNTTVFFGLSGTGKTTLSADAHRPLIGDDEHVWTDEGCYNVEGGCYAKCVNLSPKQEPEIYNAIKFGAVVENVVYDENRRPLYENTSLTENTRCAYPLEHIPGCVIPAVGDHPQNVIFLTCDAFGVLPPVSLLTPDQASYHFLSGYTAKVAGTEVGVVEPTATFSACYGGPFLVYHPMAYASRLAEKLTKHGAKAWLINTGWTGGGYGVGKRISLKDTRAIIDKIHDGSLLKAKFSTLPKFGLNYVSEVSDISSKILDPHTSWKSEAEYTVALEKLASLFAKNFSQYADRVVPQIKSAGPS